MRQCPRCGKLFPEDRMHCNVTGCSRKTVEVIDWTDEDEVKAQEDLEQGILSDPFEDYEKPKPKPKKEPEPEPKPKKKEK